MCGIVGCLGLEAEGQVQRMVDAMVHRGPDGRGRWSAAGVALGVTRLAIVDIPAGDQPMHLGDLTLVANAEIYNHRELRRELEGQGAEFQTGCDVEVLLHGYRHWGLDLLERLEGFFAFALWDAGRQRLLLARDRFGIAPLVWTRAGDHFVFASEVKGLLAHSSVRAEPDLRALDDTLALRYAPGPGTWWKGISHLPPGHLITVSPEDGACEPAPWWSPPPSGSGENDPSPQVAAERLEAALRRSVSLRAQHGEAPVGLYLSGGLDSCLVGAMLPRDAEGIPAFSHGYDGKTDEHAQASRAAGHLGLSWRPVQLAPDDLDSLPDVIRAVEQPVANSDILGLWVLAREASKEVKGVLCGEGADELFGSYPHQQLLHRLWSAPAGLRRVLGAALPMVPSALLQGRASYAGAASDREVRRRWASALGAESLGTSVRSVATLFTSEDRETLYSDSLMEALPPEPDGVVSMVRGLDGVSGDGVLDALIDQGLSGWLDGYHLGRENRIAMAHGIEARYPYLDSGVVDAVLPLSLAQKRGGGAPADKGLLRQVAKGHLTPGLTEQPKGPVRVPLSLFGSRWRELVGDLLTDERVANRGLFRPDAVRALRERESSAPFLVGRQLFALVLVEVWYEAFA